MESSSYKTANDKNQIAITAIHCFREKILLSDYTDRKLILKTLPNGNAIAIPEDWYVASVLLLEQNRIVAIEKENASVQSPWRFRLLIPRSPKGTEYDPNDANCLIWYNTKKASLIRFGDFVFCAYEGHNNIPSISLQILNSATLSGPLVLNDNKLEVNIRSFTASQINGINTLFATHEDNICRAYEIQVQHR